MNVTLAEMKKALVAGGIAALVWILGQNWHDWITGTAAFNWRSVVGGLASAAITGVSTFFVTNGQKPPHV